MRRRTSNLWLSFGTFAVIGCVLLAGLMWVTAFVVDDVRETLESECTEVCSGRGQAVASFTVIGGCECKETDDGECVE